MGGCGGGGENQPCSSWGELKQCIIKKGIGVHVQLKQKLIGEREKKMGETTEEKKMKLK